jgi:hypothetical protein
LWTFVDQVLEHGPLGLSVHVYAPVLVALAVHGDRAGEVVAVDHVSQAEAAYLAAAHSGVEQQ